MVYKVYLIKPTILELLIFWLVKRETPQYCILQKNIIIFMAIGGGLFYFKGFFRKTLYKTMKGVDTKRRIDFIQDAITN